MSSSSSRRRTGNLHVRALEHDRSPAALRRKRARAWLLASIIGLGVAVLVGLLLPVDHGSQTLARETTRSSRRR